MPVQSILPPPTVVRVKVHTHNGTTAGQELEASVRSIDDSMLYAGGSLKFIHTWLKNRGYTYVAGSSGLWTK